jgi:hypothetical protein
MSTHPVQGRPLFFCGFFMLHFLNFSISRRRAWYLRKEYQKNPWQKSMRYREYEKPLKSYGPEQMKEKWPAFPKMVARVPTDCPTTTVTSAAGHRAACLYPSAGTSTVYAALANDMARNASCRPCVCCDWRKTEVRLQVKSKKIEPDDFGPLPVV